MLMGKIDPLAFGVALGLGLMVVYMTAPRPRRVLKFPTPANAGTVVYRDRKQGCYVYESEKVPCDASAKIAPAQEEDGK